MKKKIGLTIVSVVALVSLLIGCANSVEDDAEQPENSGEKETVLRVGATTTGVPFTFVNTETGEIDGLMVDIARKIGEKLDVDIEIKETEFAALIPSIETDKIDLISAGMIITEERKEVIDFTNPVYEYGEGIVVASDTTDIHSLDDLAGRAVGVQEGTIYYEGLKDYPEINAQSYKSIADMIREIENGRIEAFIGDYPIIVHMIEENPDFDVKLVETDEQVWLGDVGLGVAKGSDLLDDLNQAIDEIKESGELDQIIEEWGL